MVLSYQRLKLLISVVICNTSSFCHLELVFSSWEGLLFSLFQFLQDHEGFLSFLESVLIKSRLSHNFPISPDCSNVSCVSLPPFDSRGGVYGKAPLCHLWSPSFPQGPFLEQPQHFKSFSLNPFFICSVSYCMHITVLEFPRYLCWFK